MTDNLREFTLELDRIAQTVPEELVTTVHRKMTIDALSKIVIRTPVDTGRARGNWQTTIDTPASSVLDIEDKSGGPTIEAGTQVARRIPPFSQSFISNNVEHILVLEQGGFIPKDPGPSKDPRGKPGSGKQGDRWGRVLVRGGYSVQAPQGMVALTFEELNQTQPENT